MGEHIKEMLNDIAALSGKVEIEIHDMIKEPETAKQHSVDDGPVILVKSRNVKGDARYYGIPSGYEFAPFLEVLRMAGNNISINDSARNFFDGLASAVKLEVFVTPTCPHCPTSAYVALKFAMASSKVKGHVYEAMEFPQVANKYAVRGVPKTVINEGKAEYVGGYPEDIAFVQIKKALAS
jgi:glutaredoxin-like protein